MIIRAARRILRTMQHWNEIDGSLLAAGVSFYASLATFPLIMVMLSIFGFILRFTGYGADLQQKLMQFVSDQSSEKLAEQLSGLLKQIETGAFLSGPIGLIFLITLSMALFVNFERAFHRIWNTPSEPSGVLRSIRRVLLHRLKAFLMLLGVALIIMLNFASNTAIEVVSEFIGDFEFAKGWWRTVHLIASVLLNVLLFTAIYQTLPRTHVPWKQAVKGGVLAALIWEIGRTILATFVITDKYSAFGVVGVFMGLLLWTFYASAVILLGGTYVFVSGEMEQEAGTHKR